MVLEWSPLPPPLPTVRLPPPALSSPPEVADDSSPPLCYCVCPDDAVHDVVLRSYNLLVRRTEVVVVVTELLRLTDSIALTTALLLLPSSSSAAAVVLVVVPTVAKSAVVPIRPLPLLPTVCRSWGSEAANSSCTGSATFLEAKGVICAVAVIAVVASLVEEDDAMSALRPNTSGDDTSPDYLVVVAAVVGCCGVGCLVTAADDSTGGTLLQTGAG